MPAAKAAAGGGYGELMLTSLLVLALVCAAAWVALRLVARWLEGRRVGSGVAVIARVPLEPRRALYVVEAGGRRLLIGSSEGGVSLLTELAADVSRGDEAGPGSGERPRSFVELLAQAASRVRRRPGQVDRSSDGGGASGDPS